MGQQGVSVRYDEGRREFVLNLEIKGLTEFEASGTTLSEALINLAEQIEEFDV